MPLPTPEHEAQPWAFGGASRKPTACSPLLAAPLWFWVLEERRRGPRPCHCWWCAPDAQGRLKPCGPHRPQAPCCPRALCPSACPPGVRPCSLVGHVCLVAALSGQLPSEEAREQLWGHPTSLALTSRACGRCSRDPALPPGERAGPVFPVHRRPRTTPCSARSCSNVHSRAGISHGETRPPAAIKAQGLGRRLVPSPGPPCPRYIPCTSWFTLLNHRPVRLWAMGVPSLTVVKPCVGVTRALFDEGRPRRQRVLHRALGSRRRARRRVAAGTAVSSEPALPTGHSAAGQLSALPWLGVEQRGQDPQSGHGHGHHPRPRSSEIPSPQSQWDPLHPPSHHRRLPAP